MNVKKFTAQTSREALRRVRDTLGADAVILSNRVVDGMTEILALAPDAISSLAAPAVEKTEPAMQPLAPKRAAAFAKPTQPEPRIEPFEMPALGSDFSSTLAQGGNGMEGLIRARQAAERIAAEPAAPAAPVRQPRPAPAAAAGNAEAGRADILAMQAEIRAMRGLMETQLAELAWNSSQKREPHKTFVLRELLAAGFSPSLARYLMEKLPADKSQEECMRWIKTVLARNLQTMNNEHEILENGGVFALVGPTGVGKTTSTAKLAARCVMRHGTDKLALITTDGYRIGGHEQLRIYGKILGVMVHSVKDEADLRIALKELKGKHTVLIDTVGVSQRDKMVEEQVAMLSGAGTDVKRLLCLNATSTGETLNEVVRAYQGAGLAGAIMTKLDEAASIGNVLDVVIRNKLTMYYVSNGQRVPEDLHLADRAFLVDRAFKLKRDTGAFQLLDDELPLLMAGASNDLTAREVHVG